LLTLSSRCNEGQAELTLSQERYAPLGSSIERARTWQIPVCLRFPTAEGSREQCLLLTQPSQTLKLESATCPAWVAPNSGAAGYYRAALDEPALRALLSARGALSEAEQLSLTSDLGASMRSGRLRAELALAGWVELAQSPSRLVLDQVLGALGGVRDKLLSEAELANYRARVAQLTAPLYQKLGLFPATGAEVSGEEKLQRSQVVRALGLEARDPALATELAALGRARLDLGSHPRSAELPSELIDAALSAALRQGDAAVLARAKEKLLAETDGTVRARLLSALGSLDQPARTAELLTLALDPRLRVNERLPLLYGQMARSETRRAAFDWLKSNEQALSAALSERHQANIIAATGGFCDEASAREVEAHFASRVEKMPGGPRDLALALESIRLCAAVSKAQTESARAYFAQAPAPAAKVVAPARKQKPKPAAP
jgi:alanyl aminopeptidase